MRCLLPGMGSQQPEYDDHLDPQIEEERIPGSYAHA